MDYFSDLSGKRVLITGARGVIGRWIAAAFIKAGCHICLTDIRSGDLEADIAKLKPGGQSFAYPADLTQEASIEALAAEIGRRWGAADVVINNAGIYPSGFLLDIETAEFDRIFSINLRAPFILTRAMARQMIAKGVKGSIIAISSGASRKMRRTVVPYCVSKTALDRLTKGFALELAEFGIRVNALEPGFAPGSAVSGLTDEHVAATIGAIPLGRPSTPADVANGLLYLASDASAYVTGATLTVDGGNSIGSLAVYQDKKNPL
ncbi:MAG: SDR family NAD(P)-dependent oxidoreductase [Hyphomicrobiales bacterium]